MIFPLPSLPIKYIYFLLFHFRLFSHRRGGALVAAIASKRRFFCPCRCCLRLSTSFVSDSICARICMICSSVAVLRRHSSLTFASCSCCCAANASVAADFFTLSSLARCSSAASSGSFRSACAKLIRLLLTMYMLRLQTSVKSS